MEFLGRTIQIKKPLFFISDKYPLSAYGPETFSQTDERDIIRITYTDTGVPGILKGPVKKRRSWIMKSHKIIQGKGDKKIEVEFLNAGSVNKRGEKQNTNLHSLVIKLSYGPHSVLLTGDATAATFLDIKNPPLWDELNNITILQSSHHGTKTEGSNNKFFISFTNPNFVVFSTPLYSTYDHPNSAIVNPYASFFHKKDMALGNYHLFFLKQNMTPLEMKHNSIKSTKGEFSPLLTYKRNPLELKEEDNNFYTLAVTNHPLFDTGSHGTIIFKWELRGDIEHQTYDYNREAIRSRNLADFPLNPTTPHLFVVSNQIDKNLSQFIKARDYLSLGIRIYNDLEVLKALFKKKRYSQLQAIYLDSLPVSTITIEQLEEALENLPHLQIFSIKEDQLPPDYKPDFLAKRFLGIK